jgi:hypothetical protein
MQFTLRHPDRSVVLRAILATPPAVLASANAAERRRVESILDHILPVAPRRSACSTTQR